MASQHGQSVGINRRTAIKGIGASALVGTAGCLGGVGDDVTELVMMTTSEETSAYQMSAGMGSIINEHSDNLRLDARPAAGSHQAMARMDQGECDIAYTTFLTADDIVNQLGEYEDNPFEHDIYSLTYYYDIILQQVAPTASEFETWEDLNGQTVYSLDVGSAARTYLHEIHDQLDLEPSEYEVFTQSEQPDAFDEGRIDIGTDLRLNQIQPGYIESLYARHDLALLEFTDEQKALMDESPRLNIQTYSADDLPGPDYRGRDEFEWSPLAYITYVTDRLDDEIYYEFLETRWEHRDELVEFHALLGDLMDPDFITKHYDFTDIAPVHPGADAFFEDYDMI